MIALMDSHIWGVCSHGQRYKRNEVQVKEKIVKMKAKVRYW